MTTKINIQTADGRFLSIEGSETAVVNSLSGTLGPARNQPTGHEDEVAITSYTDAEAAYGMPVMNFDKKGTNNRQDDEDEEEACLAMPKCF